MSKHFNINICHNQSFVWIPNMKNTQVFFYYKVKNFKQNMTSFYPTLYAEGNAHTEVETVPKSVSMV